MFFQRDQLFCKGTNFFAKGPIFQKYRKSLNLLFLTLKLAFLLFVLRVLTSRMRRCKQQESRVQTKRMKVQATRMGPVLNSIKVFCLKSTFALFASCLVKFIAKSSLVYLDL